MPSVAKTVSHVERTAPGGNVTESAVDPFPHANLFSDQIQLREDLHPMYLARLVCIRDARETIVSYACRRPQSESEGLPRIMGAVNVQ